MKKISIFLVLIIIISSLCSLVSCTKITPEEGLLELQSAYENTKTYSDIYQFNEKIYQKAINGKDGFVVNRKVNVHCAVDKKYNLVKDKDFGISIHEDKYIEKVDLTSKLTSNQIAYNDIKVGETILEGSKDKTNALFVSQGSFINNEWNKSDSIVKDITAKDFYKSEYFKSKLLMNIQVMKEIPNIIMKNVSFDVKDGGIVKKGKTLDYTFKMSDQYLEDYKIENGYDSILKGKRVWIQTSYNRIANIYVYNEEKIDNNIATDYESYIFMISYLGPNIEFEAVKQDKIADSFDGQNFKEGVLSKLIP